MVDRSERSSVAVFEVLDGMLGHIAVPGSCPLTTI
jgi:hypothetical protein